MGHHWRLLYERYTFSISRYDGYQYIIGRTSSSYLTASTHSGVRGAYRLLDDNFQVLG